MDSVERWAAIPEWEGLYEASDLGRIRSLSRPHHPGRILKPTRTADGYGRVDLSRNGRQVTRLVHRLVLAAFVGLCPEGMEVLHGPGGCGDNRLANLSYGTHSQNSLEKTRDGTTLRSEQGSGARLTWEQVADIRRRGTPRRRGIGIALAAEFGVTRNAIYEILNGHTWKHSAPPGDRPEACGAVQPQRGLALRRWLSQPFVPPPEETGQAPDLWPA